MNNIDFAKQTAQAVQRNIEILNKKSLPIAVSLYSKQSIKWIKELNQVKKLGQYITLSPMIKPLKLFYEKYFTLTYLTGYDQLKTSLKDEKDFSLIDRADPHTFPDAIRILKSKKIVPIDQFNSMTRSMKDASFSIANIERLNVLAEVRELMNSVIETGGTLEDFKKSLPETFKKFGVTPLSPHHIENVLRTNTQSLYNISRFEAISRDRNVPGMEYVAVNDSRTRPEHLQWNGLKFRKNDPIWNDIYPPNGYMCRCTVLAITLGRMEAQGIKFNKVTKNRMVKAKELSPEFNAGKNLNQYNKSLKKLERQKQVKADKLK